jgi:Flp pilus assembly pilin Flp
MTPDMQFGVVVAAIIAIYLLAGIAGLLKDICGFLSRIANRLEEEGK